MTLEILHTYVSFFCLSPTSKGTVLPAIQHVYLTSGESYNAEIQSFANISVKPDLNCVVDGGITNNGNGTTVLICTQ